MDIQGDMNLKLPFFLTNKTRVISPEHKKFVSPMPLNSKFFPNFHSDSTLKNVSTDFKKNMGKRIFVFIIGGATRSEVKHDKDLLLLSPGCFNFKPILCYIVVCSYVLVTK